MTEVLALNCGSSSLKYAAFAGDEAVVRGEVGRIGAGGAADHAGAVHAVFDELAERHFAPRAVGHRLVHGGPNHVDPERIDDALLAALAEVVPFAPVHLPPQLAAIEAVRTRFGALPQVAAFDTAFHRTLPEVARRYPLPVALDDAGIRRYGFHGLSYEYIASSLPSERLARAVFAHLGNGASMVAVRDGESVETTMGFSPTGGLVMGTRTGDLDPGLVVYLLEHGYDTARLEHLVNHEAGLIALSGTTPDMQRLLAERARDPRAALAVEAFCYQAAKWIGALTAVLGGIDTLVFTGGIGEHASEVRSEICGRLAHLGIRLNEALNRIGEGLISDGGACEVQVIRTDEELVIARATRRVLARA
jgi:acetate kinase